MSEPVRKFKSFNYHTNLVWTSNRQGVLQSIGKPEISISSPPEFKGLPNIWTPEDLFVASVEICTMSTFLSFGGRKEIPLKSYRSSAEGFLEFVNGKYIFTKIIIRPIIVVENLWSKDQVLEIIHQAHENCLIGNSMKTEIIIEPEIILE